LLISASSLPSLSVCDNEKMEAIMRQLHSFIFVKQLTVSSSER
jgi:hypothetical protein